MLKPRNALSAREVLSQVCEPYGKPITQEIIETGEALRKHLEKAEAIHHPAHYGGADNPYEAIKVIEAWGLGFHLGNTLKYIARSGKRAPEKGLEDLKKARWYLDREIARKEVTP